MIRQTVGHMTLNFVPQPPFSESSDRPLMQYGWPADHPGMVRAEWTMLCLKRLRELRPADDAVALASLVDEMWLEVSRCDPVLAAEIEHDSLD